MAANEQLRNIAIAHVSREMRDAPALVTDMHFHEERNFTTTKVEVDVVRESQEISQYTHPMADPNVVQPDEWERQTHTPPYIYETIAVRPDDLHYVRPGENIYSDETQAKRLIEGMAEDVRKLKGRAKRRKEVQACTLLNGGAMTIVGEGFPSYTVDFKMPAGNKMVLTGVDRWSQATSKPLQDIRTALDTIAEESGLRPNVMYFGDEALNLWYDHADVITFLDLRNFENLRMKYQKFSESMPRNSYIAGFYEEIPIIVYNATYLEGGVSKRYIPSKRVLFGSTDAQCAKLHGAIENLNSLKAADYFIQEVKGPRGKKLWRDLESRPLMALSQSSAFGYLVVDTE